VALDINKKKSYAARGHVQCGMQKLPQKFLDGLDAIAMTPGDDTPSDSRWAVTLMAIDAPVA
jgi:hypothetical protein